MGRGKGKWDMKGLYSLSSGSDSITGNSQDNPENGFVLILPLGHDLVSEVGNIGGCFF